MRGGAEREKGGSVIRYESVQSVDTIPEGAAASQ